jgi:hypothetical protein
MKTILRTIGLVSILLLIFSLASGQITKVPLGSEAGAAYGYVQNVPDSSTVEGILLGIPGHGERGNGTTELDKVFRIGTLRFVSNGQLVLNKFILITPQYPVTSSKMYHETLNKFITHIQNKFRKSHGPSVDNIYMIGISGGGITLLNYIVVFPRVKAAIEIAGAGSPSLAYKATNTKLWVIHGEDDRTISWTKGRDFVNAYNAASPPKPAIFTLIPFYGHEAGVWDRVCSQGRFYEWLLKP